jgi:hypothetical protein
MATSGTPWAALIVSAGIILPVSAPASAAPDTTKPGQKRFAQWEYCELQTGLEVVRRAAGGGGPGAGGAAGGPGAGGAGAAGQGGGAAGRGGRGFGGRARATRSVIRWITSDGQVEGETWQELAKKMKIPAGNKKLAEAVYKVNVLNHLGAKGWELVGIQKELNGDSWTFKRKLTE